MTRPLTAAQRRIVDAADPGTGRLRGTPAQLAALVKRGLAFRHPRPPHDHFLTPAGEPFRVRSRLRSALGHAHIGVTAGVYTHVRLRLQRQAIDALGGQDDDPDDPPAAAVVR